MKFFVQRKIWVEKSARFRNQLTAVSYVVDQGLVQRPEGKPQSLEKCAQLTEGSVNLKELFDLTYLKV